ncbi:MAG: alpha/beta hydrolase [Hyphomicrobium sp.]
MAAIQHPQFLNPMSLRQRREFESVGLVSPSGEDMARAGVAPRREASFLVDGSACRAWVYEPATDAPRPAACIVMAHGLGGTRNASLAPYAERFAEAGFFVVLFDYRFLGASEGEPRQLISPKRQLEDWQAAIDFARGLPGVDPRRIGLWGTSLSGGHVVMAAARDSGITAIAAQCPMLDGRASARMAIRRSGFLGTLRMVSAALTDILRAAVGASPYYIPLAARDGELAVMSSDAAYAGCHSIVPSDWRNEVAARILLTMPPYRPVRHAHRVTCPALIIACAQDTIVSAKAAADTAEKIGEEARLVVLPIDHFDIYHGRWLEHASTEQVAFFRSALQSGDASVKAE